MTVSSQNPALFGGHVVIGKSLYWSSKLQAFVIGQIELGPDFHLELIDHRPFLGDLDLGRIEIGRTQGCDVVFLGQLLETLQHDLGLDLIEHILMEAAFDHFARRLAGPKPRDRRIHDQLAVLLIQTAVDVGAIDRDLDVLFARPGVAHFDGLFELLRLFFGGGLRGRLGGRRPAFALVRFLISHRSLPPKVKKAENAGPTGPPGSGVRQAFSAAKSG